MANQPLCVEIEQDELKHVRRRFRAVATGDLGALRPTDSWFVAILVCPGDDLRPVAPWASLHGSDRVFVYRHETAPVDLLRPWLQEGLQIENIHDGCSDWGSLHRRLGYTLNVVVYNDHAPG